MPPPSIQAAWGAGDESEEFKADVSAFRFIEDPLRDGSKLANYFICEDLAAQRIVITGLRRGWMSVACISEGFAPANTRMIATVLPGVAERQADGGWKVKELATIKFES
jgi:hypothetical protein